MAAKPPAGEVEREDGIKPILSQLAGPHLTPQRTPWGARRYDRQVPSPIGHALGALAAGWAVGRLQEPARRLVVQTVALALIGMAPDLDLLVGRHRAETHSLGAALLVATLAAFFRWPLASTRARTWWVVFLAWSTHVLFDALGEDMGPPAGVMAFWPVSSEFVKFQWDLFLPLRREWQEPGFLLRTIRAILRELLILVPIVVVVAWWRRPRRQEYP